MACVYAIDAYGIGRGRPCRASLKMRFDEVDRIDRLMSHYKPESPLSRINREAARQPVAVEPELFDFIADAMRYNRESDGAFDITVGPLMKAWGFFRGEGRMPSGRARWRRRGATSAPHHVILNPDCENDPLRRLRRRAGSRRHRQRLRGRSRRRAAPARGRSPPRLVSAGGSTIYGLGAPPGRDGWDVAIQDPIDPQKIARTVRLKDRALSVAGSSEKSFESGGVRYSHIMDPRTGRPVQGMLSVAVLASSGTAGDALDDAFFVLGPERSREYLKRLPGTDVFFFLPDASRGWTMIDRRGGP